ncbi:MAG: hypothetical protein L6R19_17605 [Alphaproteobacteria bacterium]|nr:hypothetical protein [Alphaproteobacteria bacterium]
MSTITTRRTLLPRLPAMLALLLAAVPLPAAAAGATSFTHPQLGFTIEKPAGWDTFRDRDEPRMTLQLVKGGLAATPARQRARIAVAHQPMPRRLSVEELGQIADGMARGDRLYRQLLSQGVATSAGAVVLARTYDGDFDEVPTRSVVELVATDKALFVLRGRVPRDKLAADWDTTVHALTTFRLPAATEAVPMPALAAVTAVATQVHPRFSGLWRYHIAGQPRDGRAVMMQDGNRLYLAAAHVEGGREIVWRGEGEIGVDIALDYAFNNTAPADWRDGTMRLAVSDNGRRLSGTATNAFGAAAAITFEADAAAPGAGDLADAREPLELSGQWVEVPPPSPDRHLVILFERGMSVFITGTHEEAAGPVAWMARGGVFDQRLELHTIESPVAADAPVTGRLSLEMSQDLNYLAGAWIGPDAYRAVQLLRLGRARLIVGAAPRASIAGTWRLGFGEDIWTFSPLGAGRYAVSGGRLGGQRGTATVGADEVLVVGPGVGGFEERYRLRLAPDGSRLAGIWYDGGALAGTVELTRVGGEAREAP